MNGRQTTVLTTRQFAASIGVSESSVKRWVDDGRIAADRTAGGHRRIPVSSAIAFMREHGNAPVEAEALGLHVLPAIGELDAEAIETLTLAFEQDDLSRARAVITGRFMAGASLAEIGDHLLMPALDRVRTLKAAEVVTRRAADICAEMLGQIGSWLPAVEPDADSVVIAAGEHSCGTILPQLSALVVREQGMRDHNLGPSTSFVTVAAAAAQYRATVCVLCSDTALTKEWADAAYDAFPPCLDRIMLMGTAECTPPSSPSIQLDICSSLNALAGLIQQLRQRSAAPRTNPDAEHRAVRS